jgi:hypothetical protein
MGRLLIGIGVVLIVAGLLVIGLERVGVGLGSLPGDLVWRGRHSTIYAPLGTCLLLSVLLTLVLYLVNHFRR